MKEEPLFARFANGTISVSNIIEIFLSSTKHGPSKNIAEKAKEAPPDLSLFRKDFRNMLEDLVDNGINQRAINYVDSYMKPSLEEIMESPLGSRAGESRYIFIKKEETPWPEAMICYNLCLYIRAFGIKELKLCPICKKFFTNKGKYAKYCSDICKGQK